MIRVWEIFKFLKRVILMKVMFEVKLVQGRWEGFQGYLEEDQRRQSEPKASKQLQP